ncbi:MAG: FxsA family protein [Myxococcales bacterium]|nr:FxsA family protein [Myxococcales bacterium]
MGKLLLLLFTVVPLVELWLLLFVGRHVGLWPTIGLVLATGLLGATLARREGARVMRDWQRATSEGRLPEDGVLGGALVLVGGVLLVTPGVLTDVVGLALLLPWTRRLVARRLRARLERGIAQGRVHVSGVGGAQVFTWVGGAAARRPDVIDVEGRDITDEARPRLPDA